MTGNRTWWWIVAFAALVRTTLLVGICCAVRVVFGRVEHAGVSGLWAGTPSSLPATVLLLVLLTGWAREGFSVAAAARATRAVRRRLASRAVPLPTEVLRAAARNGLVGRVDLADVDVPLAFTHRLFRPRVQLSTALVRGMTAAELDAVLAYEGEHVRNRDPLRTSVARVLADRLFYLPLLAQLVERFTVTRELTADRCAVATRGRAAVAGALLKLVDHTAGPPAASVTSISPGDGFEARISQLQTKTPPALLQLRWRTTIPGAALLVWCAIGTAWLLARTPMG